MIFRFPTANTNPLFADLCNVTYACIGKPARHLERKQLNKTQQQKTWRYFLQNTYFHKKYQKNAY